MELILTDGGRSQYFEASGVGDCVVRAIALALDQDYLVVYKALQKIRKDKGITTSVRDGVDRKVYETYLREQGWEWMATMKIGQGCRVHLREGELPPGILIVRLSKHLSCIKDNIIYDMYDPSRGGSRCVYGYYTKVN